MIKYIFMIYHTCRQPLAVAAALTVFCTSCCFKESSPARAQSAVARCSGVKSGTASKVDLVCVGEP